MQAGAVAAVLQGWHIVGAVLYVLSINHKHMLVYFAPAFFSYLLGCCLRKPLHGSLDAAKHVASSPWRPLPQAAAAVAALGAAVIGTMLLVWAPFLAHPGLALKVGPHMYRVPHSHLWRLLCPWTRSDPGYEVGGCVIACS